MDFVETKFCYKNYVLELNLKIENMSKKWPQKPKNCSLNHVHIKIIYVGKVPKTILLIDFEAFLVRKVHKNSVFNQNCL